jgi:hypothetical protein
MYTPDAPLRGGLAVVDAKGPFRPLFTVISRWGQRGVFGVCENDYQLQLSCDGLSMLTSNDFDELANQTQGNERGHQQSTIDKIALNRGMDARKWMDWQKPGGTVLLAELAQNLPGHAYDGFVAYAMRNFWPSASTVERGHLLNCLVESLHIVVNEKNAAKDHSIKAAFEDRAVNTVCLYLDVFADAELDDAILQLNLALKGRLSEIVSDAKRKNDSSRDWNVLSELIKSELPPGPERSL